MARLSLRSGFLKFVPRVPTLFLLLFFYLFGIILTRVEGFFCIAFLSVLALFILVSHLLESHFRLLALSGALLIFVFGLTRLDEAGFSNLEETEWENVSGGKIDFQGVLFKVPEKVRYGERLYIKIETLGSRRFSKPVNTVVRITCYKFSSKLQYGDTVKIRNVRLRKPSNYKNPGGFNYKQYLLDRGIELTGSIRKPGQIVVLERGSSWSFIVQLYTLKKRLTRFIQERSDPLISAFIEATSFGERGSVSPELRELFSKIGTSHILAVSGLHVGFVSFMFYSVFKIAFSFLLIRQNIRSFMLGHAAKYAATFTIPFVAAYVLMVGSSSSSFRAAVMGIVFLLSIIIGKERELFSVIALSAMILLLENPVRLLEIGFQLSFCAVTFIVYGYQKFRENEPEANKFAVLKGGIGRSLIISCRNLLIVSLLAGVGTAPLTAYYFNIVSIVGPISNVVILPIVAIIVPSSLIISILSLFWESAATMLLTLPIKLSMVLLALSEGLSKMPFGYFRVSNMESPVVLLFFIGIVSAISLLKTRGTNKLSKYIFFAVGIIFVFIFFSKKETTEGGGLVVTYLDVGQGNSALIEAPSGKRLLIDGGRAFGDFSIGRSVVSPFLWKKGVTEIDYVIGTHQDSDHIGGLEFILKEFDVKEYIDNGDKNEKISTRILETLRKRNIFHRVVGKGDVLKMSSRVNVSFLNPEKAMIESKNDNDRGLVIKVSFENISILFNGDISSKIEQRIIEGGNIHSTIMDAPHHGSRFSNSANYIRAVSPEVVIISVGDKNPFGHPVKAVLDRYMRLGVKVLRTDVHGAVVLKSDGESFSVVPTIAGPIF